MGFKKLQALLNLNVIKSTITYTKRLSADGHFVIIANNDPRGDYWLD